MTLSSDRILTILLVGLGGMGRVWLDGLLGPVADALGVRLVAICDLDPQSASASLSQTGVDLPVYASIIEALSINPDIVVDSTTPNARMAILGAALAHGTNVLCEKPLATNDEEARRLLGMAARAPGQLAVSQNRRFHSGVRQMRALVVGGALGRPQRLVATLHMAPHFGGHRERMRNVMLGDMAIHAFDTARAILRQDAVSVICVERQVEGSRFAHAADVTCIFEMSGGAQFCFDGSWTDVGPPSSWNGTWRLTLARGSARWDGEGDAMAYAAPAEGTLGLLTDPVPHSLAAIDRGHSDIMGALASFVSALRAGVAAETSAFDNVRSLAMTMAAIRSAAAYGRSEPVPDLAHSGDSGDFVTRDRVYRAVVDPDLLRTRQRETS